jgi:hypothetical protein
MDTLSQKGALGVRLSLRLAAAARCAICRRTSGLWFFI